jgi:hypothetical protein
MIKGKPCGTNNGWFNHAGIATVNYGPGMLVRYFPALRENISLVQLWAIQASFALPGYRFRRDEFAGATAA